MDEYEDDTFNELDNSILQELENNAIQATQAKLAQTQGLAQSQFQFCPPQAQFRPIQPIQPPRRPQNQLQQQHNVSDYGLDDDDFDDTIVIDESARLPPRTAIEKTISQNQPRLAAVAGGTQRWNQHLPQPRPTYPPRPQFRRFPQQSPQTFSSPRYPPGSSRPQPHHPLQPSQFSRPAPFVPRPSPPVRPPQVAYPFQPSQPPHAGNQNDLIAELTAKLNALEQELITARGEASILRSKYDKAQAAHDAELAALKKKTAEQLAKQERLIEEARAAEKMATTELQFARQDLREELTRTKARRKDKDGGAGPSTPRKNRAWGVPDGFDDVEILGTSPNKGQARRREAAGDRTPTKKRKRPVVDSPTFVLETEGGDVQVVKAPKPAPVMLSSRPGLSFDFLRVIIDHGTVREQPPTFDLLSRFSFPSDPTQSFSSIIFQKLPKIGDSHDPLRLLADFVELIIDLWQRCLSERYHTPIYYLASLALYTLLLNTESVAPHIISSLIPVCATTCRLVALPRLNSVDGNLAEHPDPAVRQLLSEIDVGQCLSLLHLAALGCLSPPVDDGDNTQQPKTSTQTQFWRTMELDFVLLMLSPKHPETEWLQMLNLLWTSVTPDSLGPIPSFATDQSAGSERPGDIHTTTGIAAMVIDCVSSFLCEPPLWATPGTIKDAGVRIAAVQTLTMFATSPFGAMQLAMSDVAIPRLVTVLSWAIDRLYDMDVEFPLRPEKRPLFDKDEMQHDCPKPSEADDNEESHEPDPMTLFCRLIAETTKLLHYLATDSRTANVANLAGKLAASYGGSQRHLISLARLNFAEEDLIFEAGIDAETIELAHDLIELAVTPDEGREVVEVFG